MAKTRSLKKSRLFQEKDKALKKAQLMKVVKKSIVHIFNVITQRSLKLSSLKDMKSKSKKTKTSMPQNG